jgi:hypothetical protein
MKLSNEEGKIRAILIRTAQGSIKTHRPGLISYSELWGRASSKPWGRGRKSQIVDWISHISTYELSQGRPPLNELVVRKGTDLPGEPWSNIKRYHKKRLKIDLPFKSHEEAQEACWQYWAKRKAPSAATKKSGDQAEEGYKQDRTITFRKRNAALILARKVKDHYTCLVCTFRMKVNGSYVIDCHHTNPLGLTDKVRVTRISQLVCLCPTCHRIAHTRQPPLTVSEIKVLLARGGGPTIGSTGRRPGRNERIQLRGIERK